MSQSPVIEKASSAATYVGGGGALVFGMTANELAAIVGATVAVLGFLANLWFRWQHLKVVRQAAESRPYCASCPERDV